VGVSWACLGSFGSIVTSTRGAARRSGVLRLVCWLAGFINGGHPQPSTRQPALPRVGAGCWPFVSQVMSWAHLHSFVSMPTSLRCSTPSPSPTSAPSRGGGPSAGLAWARTSLALAARLRATGTLPTSRVTAWLLLLHERSRAPWRAVELAPLARGTHNRSPCSPALRDRTFGPQGLLRSGPVGDGWGGCKAAELAFLEGGITGGAPTGRPCGTGAFWARGFHCRFR
jgi:hypothetical protein